MLLCDPSTASSLTSFLKRSISALVPMRAFFTATVCPRQLPLNTVACSP